MMEHSQAHPRRYRLIFLINIDAKMSKQNASKQNPTYILIKRIMQHIQGRFIPGKKGLFKIHKSNVRDHTKKKKKKEKKEG